MDMTDGLTIGSGFSRAKWREAIATHQLVTLFPLAFVFSWYPWIMRSLADKHPVRMLPALQRQLLRSILVPLRASLAHCRGYYRFSFTLG
jgi:hypothetical protein